MLERDSDRLQAVLPRRTVRESFSVQGRHEVAGASGPMARAMASVAVWEGKLTFPAHVLSSTPGSCSTCALALWMHLITQRRSISAALLSPALDAFCMDSHAYHTGAQLWALVPP